MKGLVVLFLLAGVLLTGCGTAVDKVDTADAVNNVNNVVVTHCFSDVMGSEWKLKEVYINGADTLFRRDGLPDYNELFTLAFIDQTMSGVGAPNRFSAPYTLSDNQAISVLPARATLMASLWEPEYLKEHDYFNYITNSFKWNIVNGNFELSSRTGDGRDVRLVFER
ncbi:MAG: META domain-containing protein [Treponema sp.]|nr:META domain-containing protein [Treponema sp.]